MRDHDGKGHKTGAIGLRKGERDTGKRERDTGKRARSESGRERGGGRDRSDRRGRERKKS